MRTNIYKIIFLSLISSSFITISGCSNIKSSLGLEKEAPDEFAVITRAPLEMPPKFTLPPPVPGMARPQEKTPLDTAKETLFGDTQKQIENTKITTVESTLLNKAGANDATNDIRTIVNNETKKLQDRNTPVAKKLLNIGKDSNNHSATIVDSKKEYERIKHNIDKGKNILDGETPIIEE